MKRDLFPLRYAMLLAFSMSIAWGIFFFQFRSTGFDQYDVVDYYRSILMKQPMRPAMGFALLEFQIFLSAFFPAQFALVLPSILSGGMQAGLTYLIGRRFLQSDWLGIATSILMTVLPVSIVYSTIGMTDIVQSAFCLLCFWCFVEAMHAKPELIKRWLLGGAVSFGLLMGIKTVQALILPSLVLMHWLARERSLKIMLRDLPQMLIAVVLTIVVWRIPAALILQNTGETGNIDWLLNQIRQFNVLVVNILEKYTGISGRLDFPYQDWAAYFFAVVPLVGLTWILMLAKARVFDLAGILAQSIFIAMILLAFKSYYARVLLLHGTHNFFWKFVTYSLGFIAIGSVAATFFGKRISFKWDWHQCVLLVAFLPYVFFFLLLVGAVPRYFLPVFALMVMSFARPITSNFEVTPLRQINHALLLYSAYLCIGLVSVRTFPKIFLIAQAEDSRTALFRKLSSLTTESSPSVLVDNSNFWLALEIYRHTHHNASISYERVDNQSDILKYCDTGKQVFVSIERDREVKCLPSKSVTLIEAFSRPEIVIEDAVSVRGFSLWKVDCSSIQSCE